MNDPKVVKLGKRNDLEIFYKWYGFGLKGQRSMLGLTAIRRLFNFQTLRVPSSLQSRFLVITMDRRNRSTKDKLTWI